MSADYYSLGAMLCSEGGKEFYQLLRNRRKGYLATLLSPDTPQGILVGLASSIRTIDGLLGTLDKGLVVFCKTSNAKMPEWRKDELRIPEPLEIDREE